MAAIIIGNKLEGLFAELNEEQRAFLEDFSLSPENFISELQRGDRLSEDWHDEVLDIYSDEHKGVEDEVFEKFDKYLKTYFGLNDDNA